MSRGRAPFRTRLAGLTFSTCLMLHLTAAALAAPVEKAARDPVLFWNEQTNIAIQTTLTDPFQASRALALESIVVLDTVRSMDAAPGLMVRLAPPADVKRDVAVAAAAHAVLSALFPSHRAILDAALARSLAGQPGGPSRDNSASFGRAVAAAVFAIRDRDGWNARSSVSPVAAEGVWRPTPPSYRQPMMPQWATMEPFALTSGSQFRPAGPPTADSPALREAAAQVAAIGGAQSTVRTPAQTEVAHYWSDSIGTYAPAGHWNAITTDLLATSGQGMAKEAELLAELNVAMTDAGIAVADAKYTYWFWRPITVIRTGLPGFRAQPEWSPLLDTPNHPSYVSGHSGFSGAAAVVLTARLGNRPFSFSSASLPGVTRTFANFQQAAEEAAMSRFYGGIHFPFDNIDGLATGRAVGQWTLAVFQRIGEDKGPIVLLDRPDTTGSIETRGYALDNAAPVSQVSIRMGSGAPIVVAVDARGRFISPKRAVDQRQVLVTATSASGRSASASLAIEGSGAISVPMTVR